MRLRGEDQKKLRKQRENYKNYLELLLRSFQVEFNAFDYLRLTTISLIMFYF